MQEAREMAEDAVSCYLESALKHGEPSPKDAEPTTERLAVSL
jgi:predicted RNase H-like HicB family nuclease